MHLLTRKKLTKKFDQLSKKSRWHFIQAIDKRNQITSTNVMKHSNNNWMKLSKLSKQSWAMMQTYNKNVVKLLRRVCQELRWDNVVKILGQDCAQETLWS